MIAVEYTIEDSLQHAFNHFNTVLFDGDLPPTIITLQRGRSFRGYFKPEAFKHREDELTAHEIAMNPDTFTDRQDNEILSTLVHEMAHHWQQIHGKPGKGGYHNQEWANKMVALGLQPVSIDNPGGVTGRKLTHEIMPGGPFELACTDLLDKGFHLAWESRFELKPARDRKRNKIGYACETCDTKAWGKPGLSLICGACDTSLIAEEID